MSDQVIITAEAKQDIEVILDYLNEISESYGTIFYTELEADIAHMTEAPELFIRVRGTFRRLYMKRFKYHMIFIVGDSVIRLIAVVHESRHTERWMGE
jgi:plasmid stabilization system protein ParE